MEINHIEGYDCIDDNLRIVLNNSNIDIRKIFNKLWYFRFDKNQETIGNGLMQTNDDKYKELKDNFNINYEIYENKDRDNKIILKDFGESKIVGINEIDNIIKTKNKKKNIIILEVNTFKYKYDKGFRKYTGTHSCIITEKNGDKAKIIDVWYKLNNVEMEYKELLNSITRIIILDISNIKVKKIAPKEFATYLLDERSIKEMKDFFEKVKEIDLNKEYLGLDFEMVFKEPIDKGLRKTIMNRQRFAYYLYYLSEQLENKKIRELGECIFIISMDWIKLRSILVQTYFLNKTINKEQINKISQDILEKEIKIKKEIGEVKW